MATHIGDPVVPAYVSDEKKEGLWVVYYKGPSRSVEVEGMRFEQGRVYQVPQGPISTRLAKTSGFELRLARRSPISMGRVLQVYRESQLAIITAEQLGMALDLPPEEQDKVRACRYSYLVCSVEGDLADADAVRPVTDDEQRQLQQQEVDRVMNGQKPYGGRLMLAGKGKWKQAVEWTQLGGDFSF